MKKMLYPFAFLLFLGSSCESYFDINQDPSNPQVAEGFALLPPIFAQMVRGDAWDARYIGQYVQYWGWVSAGNAWDRQGFAPGSDACGEKWRSHYWSIGTNIDLIISDGVANAKWDYVGAAKAVRAWSWQSTTDLHGEMILKQAWEPNRYVFDYDPQQDVYAEVVRLSNEALTDLDKTGYSASLSRGDLVYKGDLSKWKKFIYANLARNAIHLSNKTGFSADKVIEYVDKAFQNNTDNFMVPHAGTNSGDANFFGPLRNNIGNFVQSAYIISLLDGTTFAGVRDPRLPIMFTASPDNVFRGVAPASGDPNNIAGRTNRIPNLWGGLGVRPATGRWIFNDNTPHAILIYPELQFIKAEAAFKKGDKTMAYSAFILGVSSAMDFVGVSAANRNTYLASAATPKSGNDLTLSDIMLQKYIALYGQGALETWVDMRRYDYSNEIYKGISFPTSLYPDNSGKLVQRVRPRFNSEYVWNLATLRGLGADLPDYHTKQLWFVQP